jgi:hypothetical protein
MTIPFLSDWFSIDGRTRKGVQFSVLRVMIARVQTSVNRRSPPDAIQLNFDADAFPCRVLPRMTARGIALEGFFFLCRLNRSAGV